MNDILQKVAEAIAEKTGTSAGGITMETTFESLSVDSLDMVDIMVGLEDDFNISIEMSEDLKSVGDVVRLIAQEV